MTTKREIEKLEAIGYEVITIKHLFRKAFFAANLNNDWFCVGGGRTIVTYREFKTENAAWDYCSAHAQSPEGMKATMADKVRWLIEHCHDAALVELFRDTSPLGMPKPEAAVDALFWKVP